MIADRKLVLDLGNAPSVVMGRTAPHFTLVQPAVHELDAGVGAIDVGGALVAFPLDLVAAAAFLVVHSLLAQKLALILVAGLLPLVTAFAKVEGNLLLAYLLITILEAQLLSDVIAPRVVEGNLHLTF